LYSRDDIDVRLNGTRVMVVDEIKYLGIYLHDNIKYNEEYKNKFKSVERYVYSLNSYGMKLGSPQLHNMGTSLTTKSNKKLEQFN
jgi:hypothetical protein